MLYLNRGEIMKQKCAKYAAKLIQDGMVVGLGAGSTIGYLIDFIKDKDIQIVTPSVHTALLAQEAGLNVLETRFIDHIDIAFDGCDEVDFHCNALKSAGGIHTQEKIIASMADEYIVLIDESKYFQTLPFQHPIVLEVLCNAYCSVVKKVEALGGHCNVRKSETKDGFCISDEGNYLIDVTFDSIKDISYLNQTLLMMPGIVDTSLFVNIVSGIIMTSKDGVFKKDKDGEFYAL